MPSRNYGSDKKRIQDGRQKEEVTGREFKMTSRNEVVASTEFKKTGRNLKGTRIEFKKTNIT